MFLGMRKKRPLSNSFFHVPVRLRCDICRLPQRSVLIFSRPRRLILGGPGPVFRFQIYFVPRSPDLGEQRKQQVNFFAPLVGVFGLEGATQLQHYKNVSMQPYGIKSSGRPGEGDGGRGRSTSWTRC